MCAAVHYSHPLMAHQTRTEATAQTMSAPGAAAQSDAGADMAAGLQRIEALAAEIARAQVVKRHQSESARSW